MPRLMHNWKKVMFPNETIISRVGSFGKSYYHSGRYRRQFQPYHSQATLQGGRREMMMWGCITFFWCRWCLLDPSKGRFRYLTQCRQGLYSAIAQLVPDGQGDIHLLTRHCTHTYCTQGHGVLCEGEHHCPSLARRLSRPQPYRTRVGVHQTQTGSVLETPKTLEELCERVQKIWLNIPNDFLQRLYESILKRLEEV